MSRAGEAQSAPASRPNPGAPVFEPCDVQVIKHALEVAGAVFAEDAKRLEDVRLVAHFLEQQREALEVAARLEEIDVLYGAVLQ